MELAFIELLAPSLTSMSTKPGQLIRLVVENLRQFYFFSNKGTIVGTNNRKTKGKNAIKGVQHAIFLVLFIKYKKKCSK